MKERYNMSNKEEKSCASTNINWYPRTYGKNQKANNRRLKTN